MFQTDLLKGRVVLITGGGTGLGLAMATKLASLGAAMFLVGRREEPLRKAADDIRAAGGACEYACCDVRDASSVESAVVKAESDFGQVDTLVNNAAGNFLSRTERLSSNAFAAVVGIVLQ